MAKIKFENGTVVNFEGTPTQSDVEEVAQRLGIGKKPTRMGAKGLEGVGVGIAKGTLSTLKGAGELGTKIGQFFLNKPLQAITGNKLSTAPILTPGTSQNTDATEYLKPQGTAEKIGRGLEQIAEFAIPASKVATATRGLPVVPRIASQIATDTAVSTVQEGTINKDVGTTAVVSTVFSSLPFVGKIIGKNLGLEKITSKLARNMEAQNMKLSPLQREELNKRGEDIVGYLTKKKIIGNPIQRYKKIDVLYNKMEERVQKTLTKSGVSYPKEKLVQIIDDVPVRYSTQFDNPEVYEKLVKLSDQLKKYVQTNFKGEIPIEKVNQFKRTYYKNAFNKAGDKVVNDARLALGDSLYQDVLQNVPQLKSINKDYGKVILARKILGKAVGRNQLGLIGNIVSTAAGSMAGASMGGPLGGAAGAVVGPKIAKVVAGTKARSIVGASSQKLTEYLKTLQPDKAGNLVIPKSVFESLINSEN